MKLIACSILCFCLGCVKTSSPVSSVALSNAWWNGYWIGASNGVSAAQQQIAIARKGSPPDTEVFRQNLLSGLTNNPYTR